MPQRCGQGLSHVGVRRPINFLVVEVEYIKKKILYVKKMEIISTYGNLSEIERFDRKVYTGFAGLNKEIFNNGIIGHIRIRRILSKKIIGYTNYDTGESKTKPLRS